tara:strand:- start:58 stop:312 length:255 start_codon:yes stop_codon:yes gene_type:complete
MKKILFILLSFFLINNVSTKEENKNDSDNKSNEKSSKDCQLAEEYILVEKDNIQNIAGTSLEIGGVKLRPEGCAWNSEKGWHKP